MKKMTLQEFFGGPGPGYPGSHDSGGKHKFPRPYKTHGRNEFPYVEDAGEVMSDEEIEEELGLDESLSLVEFYKAGKTMPGTDAMSYGKLQSSGGGFGGGKSSSGYQGAGKHPNSNDEDPVEADEAGAMPIEWMNEPSADTEEFDEYFGITETIGMRDRATKEGGPVSTKQPWKDGIPNSGPNYTTEDDVDEEVELDALEQEVGLSLRNTFDRVQESFIKEWADDDYGRHITTKKADGAEDDLEFWNNIEDGNPYYWTSEEEFKQTEKSRRKKRDNAKA